ncbi:DUF2157 domain-containing protein [Alteromonas gilva]|uniref:DUF2157 domain-containing protein n=1 Tax=Alteromonas gilva TaxID=2987522 RepID=A0ABT5L2T7_9ALTE|nr:DUF2157 domain-containing protein [Alteromonas gilva]MDC8831365.1 DUF2157 domain-containing protein [Alteromonas gilva]
MKITRKNLDDAVVENIITAEQAVKLHNYLASLPSTGPTFNFTNVLYYLGGLIAIGAMTLFMNLGWEAFGGWGIFFISLAYAGIGLILAGIFQEKGYAIPAGICATFSVSLTPLAVYGLQQALGLWPDESVYREYHKYIKWHWLYMELATLIVGLIVVWRYKYPFLVMPIAVTTWYMSMDVAVMIMGDYYDFEFRALVTMYFGILMIFGAFWIDIRSQSRIDYAFWLYILGVMAFWGGMTAQDSDSEISKFIYFCVNLFMIIAGVVIVRRVFVVFGALGSCLYLGHLAQEVFEDSWLFPMTLTAIGLLIVYLGVVWQKNEKALAEKARSLLPDKIKKFIEAKAN